jgi:hypothetical protein
MLSYFRVVAQLHNKRQIIDLPALPARDSAFRSAATVDQDPYDWFAHATADHPLAIRDHKTRCPRMVAYHLPKSHILLYTDGSCLN